MAFWIACSMKAIKEQIDEQPKIIKLFSINYARDLEYPKSYMVLFTNLLNECKVICLLLSPLSSLSPLPIRSSVLANELDIMMYSEYGSGD